MSEDAVSGHIQLLVPGKLACFGVSFAACAICAAWSGEENRGYCIFWLSTKKDSEES